MGWIELWMKVQIVGWAMGLLIPVAILTGAWLVNKFNKE